MPIDNKYSSLRLMRASRSSSYWDLGGGATTYWGILQMPARTTAVASTRDERAAGVSETGRCDERCAGQPNGQPWIGAKGQFSQGDALRARISAAMGALVLSQAIAATRSASGAKLTLFGTLKGSAWIAAFAGELHLKFGKHSHRCIEQA